MTARDATINIRVVRRQRDLIDRAAKLTNKTRSSFILDAATVEAENAVLDQTVFRLSPEKYKQFVEKLDAPPADNPRLRTLLSGKSPWRK
jgi:uncharacterized protein (DUF1778 family)